jgi:hypothetical protein
MIGETLHTTLIALLSGIAMALGFPYFQIALLRPYQLPF